MPQFKYDNVSGTPVIDVIFNDTKQEQEWLKRIPRRPKKGFALVAVWLPGVQSTIRSAERSISRLRIFSAPLGEDAKPIMDLGVQLTEQDEEPAVATQIPEELRSLNDQTLQALAPQLGAAVTARTPRPELLVAIGIAIAKNPRNWDQVRAQLARRRHNSPGPQSQQAEQKLTPTITA